ncbi:MAG TPA: N-acetylneuraminate synthase family protein [Tepidisphaeraceae bacterium]|jgi:N-acetylneuraminate synthase/N,N'-diacetyllegionaminate synthase|nr:N-acetylneuraminate synthase family protein [Tepidisphaeraceae bacterium]
MKRLKIGERTIGSDLASMVVAEIGVNHDGSVDRALQLVEIAASAGADAVKLQIFRGDRLIHASSGFADYQRSRVKATDPAEMLKKYELSAKDLQRVVKSIREHELIPIATPFSVEDVETIALLDLPAVKIASPDLVNRPLLERVAQLGRPMLVSTGAATLEEVDTTVKWLEEWGARFAMLHCISAYPAPPEQAHLLWMSAMAQRYEVPVGFSDHTNEPMAGAFAVAAGAGMIEKHLTYDRRATGPDHSASASPADFATYVELIHFAEQMRGGGQKRVLPIEQDVRTISRQSLVLARDKAAGEEISADDLRVQRPGTGISAADLMNAIGRSAKQALKAGTLLQWDMLSDAA